MSYPLPVPVALSRGVELRPIDYQADQRQGRIDATGKALVEWDPPDNDQLWRIERIVVTSTSTATLGVSVYGGTVQPQNLRDWTQLPPGWSGVAEYPAPMTIENGQWLALLFAGGLTGEQVTAHIQYQQVRKVWL